jgi:hypothetical protein
MTRAIAVLFLCSFLLAFHAPAAARQSSGAAGPSQVRRQPGMLKVPAKKPPPARKNADPAVGKTRNGKTVYEGSRGGFYYFTKSGHREYVQDFVGSKIVGRTPDGKNVFEGPRGGRFYYNARGEKIYVTQ